MKTEFLKGLGLSEEVIAKIFAENGRSINDLKARAEDAEKELASARGKISDYENEIAGLREGQKNTSELEAKIAGLQSELDKRVQKAQELQKMSDLKMRFEKASGGAKFLNDFTRQGIWNEFMKEIQNEENAGRSDSEIFDAVTINRENLFMPSEGIPSVVASGRNGFSGGLTDGDIREIMGLPALPQQ